ncbi:MAG: ATP-dependent endonuclease [Microbacterium sp.]|nr:MAG: ATP-dependent endonuclease [Microbacterium sp.]
MAETVIVVEGDSDRVAVEVIAARLGVTIPRVVVLGGAHGARRVRAALPGVRLLGLVDVRERVLFDGEVDAIFVCDPDLEGELVRAVGVDAVLEVIAAEGELLSFHRLQQQPAQRDLPLERHLARFFSGRSGNKHRYAALLAEAVPLDRIPAPLAALVAAAAGSPDDRETTTGCREHG